MRKQALVIEFRTRRATSVKKEKIYIACGNSYQNIDLIEAKNLYYLISMYACHMRKYKKIHFKVLDIHFSKGSLQN